MFLRYFVKKTRQYNDFHRFCMKTHDSTTFFNCFHRIFKKMTEKPYVFAGNSPKSCVFLSFGMGSDRHIHPFGAPDPKYVRRFPSQMTEKPYDFALFCMKTHDSTTVFIDFVWKSTTVQRRSSMSYKKHDSATIFIDFLRKPRQHNGFHCVSTTTHLPSQTRCHALPPSRHSAIRPSLPIPETTFFNGFRRFFKKNNRNTLCVRRFFKKKTEKKN